MAFVCSVVAANAHVYDAPVALAGFKNTVFVFKRLANTKHGRLDSFFQVRTHVGAHTQATRTKEKMVMQRPFTFY